MAAFWLRMWADTRKNQERNTREPCFGWSENMAFTRNGSKFVFVCAWVYYKHHTTLQYTVFQILLLQRFHCLCFCFFFSFRDTFDSAYTIINGCMCFRSFVRLIHWRKEHLSAVFGTKKNEWVCLFQPFPFRSRWLVFACVCVLNFKEKSEK